MERLRSTLPEPIKAVFRPIVRHTYQHWRTYPQWRAAIAQSIMQLVGVSIVDWLSLFDPKHVTFLDSTDRRPVSPDIVKGADVAVILALGQSNIANECDPNALITEAKNVYNLNFLDGSIYEAKDPLLGTTQARSNILTKLGVQLVQDDHYAKVLLVPIAHGGSFIEWWSPRGIMAPRLKKAIRLLKYLNIEPTHIVFQQGESEANHSPATEATARAWEHHFRLLVKSIRRQGLQAPIYVAICTVCGGGSNELVRRAQQSVVSSKEGIFSGPDLDTILDRWDGCHFSEVGMDQAVTLWVALLSGNRTA